MAETNSQYPARYKRSKAWIFILLAVVLALGGSSIACRQSFSLATPPGGATAAQEATRTPTPPDPGLLPAAQTPEAVGGEAALAAAAGPQDELTQKPSDMPALEPAATAVLTETPLPTSAPVVIGGADKIAFISSGKIWTANLDGSELTQLTDREELKTYLRWLPDGLGLSYIAGKCIHIVSLQAIDQIVTCFNNARYLKSFEVSPDGAQVVISLDNQLYLLPFDLLRLREAHTHGNLASMGYCVDLAPYRRNFGLSVRWSKDSKMWAAEILGVLKDGRRGDLIQVFAVDNCQPNQSVKVQFPEPHFTYKGYETNPTIENFAWDGTSLFVFNDNKRNDGFGDLHIFDMDKFQPMLSINPVQDVCCYRDAQWSPDGSYLVFAFQDYLQGSSSTTQLYMVPFEEIGTGAVFDPLPLPEITDPREKPQPVLRPANNP